MRGVFLICLLIVIAGCTGPEPPSETDQDRDEPDVLVLIVDSLLEGHIIEGEGQPAGVHGDVYRLWHIADNGTITLRFHPELPPTGNISEGGLVLWGIQTDTPRTVQTFRTNYTFLRVGESWGFGRTDSSLGPPIRVRRVDATSAILVPDGDAVGPNETSSISTSFTENFTWERRDGSQGNWTARYWHNITLRNEGFFRAGQIVQRRLA